ncbi:uncharacterized protein LOC126621169 isoform X2 [Malus sylvestris]|uniref:uncharacterized protein LOC126621169 isoform X2 n=1 Tax=Malus sylvestris TaxID=3752 RepID=UPI0021ABB049|nr:uncharacterized protein LOC126621169 isoform X2 [Malus sylvestris]
MSSNYDNTVKKTIGGRKGYSAKLMNIFSTEFIIETADGMRQKKYKQGRDHGLMLVVEKMENLITLLMLLTFICKVNLETLVKVTIFAKKIRILMCILVLYYIVICRRRRLWLRRLGTKDW